MSISNELTSELASALVNSLKTTAEADPKELAKIVLNFHSALMPLEIEASRRRARNFSIPAPRSDAGAQSAAE